MLAHVDCTVEKEVCKKFEVRGYPSVKFFSSGTPMEYGGPRTEEGIIGWCIKKTGPSTVDLKTKDAIDKFIADNKVGVVFFGEKG
mgnify:CR=1 FL=1